MGLKEKMEEKSTLLRKILILKVTEVLHSSIKHIYFYKSQREETTGTLAFFHPYTFRNFPSLLKLFLYLDPLLSTTFHTVS